MAQYTEKSRCSCCYLLSFLIYLKSDCLVIESSLYHLFGLCISPVLLGHWRSSRESDDHVPADSGRQVSFCWWKRHVFLGILDDANQKTCEKPQKVALALLKGERSHAHYWAIHNVRSWIQLNSFASPCEDMLTLMKVLPNTDAINNSIEVHGLIGMIGKAQTGTKTRELGAKLLNMDTSPSPSSSQTIPIMFAKDGSVEGVPRPLRAVRLGLYGPVGVKCNDFHY